MRKWLEELEKKLNSMSQEELDAEWKELEKYNNCGPTVEEYFESLKKYGLYMVYITKNKIIKKYGRNNK
jgi:hypothetical protein